MWSLLNGGQDTARNKIKANADGFVETLLGHEIAWEYFESSNTSEDRVVSRSSVKGRPRKTISRDVRSSTEVPTSFSPSRAVHSSKLEPVGYEYLCQRHRRRSCPIPAVPLTGIKPPEQCAGSVLLTDAASWK
jgi:hypothetical protein